MNNNALDNVLQRGDFLGKVDGTEDASSQRISISKISRNALSSNLNSKIEKKKIKIRKTEPKPEPKTAFGKFLRKCGEKIRKWLSSNGELDLRNEIRKEYGNDIAQAIPDGKVSREGLNGVKKILGQEIKSFETQTGYTFYKAENGDLAHWEALPQSVSQTMKPTQKLRVTPQNPPARKSMYNFSPSMSVKPNMSVKSNQEDSSSRVRDVSVAGTSTSQSGPENLLSVKLDRSELTNDRLSGALKEAGKNNGMAIWTGVDTIRVIRGDEVKGYSYNDVKVCQKMADRVSDEGKVMLVLERFDSNKSVKETLKLDVSYDALPKSARDKLSAKQSEMQKSVDSSNETKKSVGTVDQKILTQKGPSGLFTILQNAGVPNDDVDSKYMEEYKRNPEKLLLDARDKVQGELFQALGFKTYPLFAGVIDEKNKFPETPQEREKLINEVFSELKIANPGIFNEGFSDEEIKQLIDMEVSCNNLENGKSLCDNDFAYVAAEVRRPVLLQAGTKDDPSYILFSPTAKSTFGSLNCQGKRSFEEFQSSIHRFSKSELQDELCKDTKFLESFKNAIFIEKDRDGGYLSAGQELTDSCQNMIAAGDVEAEKRAEAARKAEEAKKAEKEAEAKMEALPHVKLTDAELEGPAFRRVLEDAVKTKGLSVEGFLKKIVFLLKDGIEKGYFLENIRIYPDSKDSEGAIIVMKRFSTSKGKNETLELNVSRDALPESIQSKLDKLV